METNKKDLHDQLSFAIDYIEEHLTKAISLDELSQNVYVSKFHLHRIFKALTGEKPMTYVRRRKLSQSAEALLHSDYRVSDIAQEFGFEHHQSYIRAFKQAFGVTPLQFRHGQSPVTFYEKIQLESLFSLDEGILTSAQVKLYPEINLMGERHRIYLEDNYRNQTAAHLARDFFYHRSKNIQNRIHPKHYFGITLFEEGYPLYTDYLTASLVTTTKQVQNDLASYTLPAQKYYCFKYIGMHHPDEISSKTLVTIWQRIFQTWMPSIGYNPTLQMEVVDYGQCSEKYCEVDILYPKEAQ